MDKKEVVEFPSREQKAENDQQKMQEHLEQIAKRVEDLHVMKSTNIKSARESILKLLDNDGLVAGDTVTAEHIYALRDTRSALDSLATATESINELFDMMISDTANIYHRVTSMTEQMKGLGKVTGYTTTVIHALVEMFKEKKLLSIEELESYLEAARKEAIDQVQEEMKNNREQTDKATN